MRGTACNNDGNRKVSYTAPSVEGQAEVIRRAVAMANVTPESVSYIEAHGTGTMMGDPIEIAGLTKVYSPARIGSIGVGSLKSNIGHLDAGAGVSALIKTALALQHKTIPATLHFRSINPQIDLETTPFYIVSRTQSWERSLLPGGRDEYAPLRAGVSSFGIGGTNVHMSRSRAGSRYFASTREGVRCEFTDKNCPGGHLFASQDSIQRGESR
ncbi:polyketide synthase [Paenibacillus melissococcoides]|uniref:Polyketide synthase n=1 Tax=Paenibacillus melissococcoides TaxID=2912268 RepID=A0ABM9G3Y4_9BACL|nr:polyketide synthase [Paenibacillus melissococcoides]MEB9895621.1 polyketide synthase [Bacillus cereus]CAH8246374.1 polyketide synthase [Paenibacillus melissococcoides]CAH8714553.1 polyketide synthase [Paenibacillus melissococcoides]CAH8715509.1 polyketide synthase [Paenibacillus melissococcoides]